MAVLEAVHQAAAAAVRKTMLRKNFKKRTDYPDCLDQIGFQYHSVLSSDNERYWTEGVAYEFTLERIEEIESVSASLHDMCLETVREIVESGDYPNGFRLNDQSKSLIEHSWKILKRLSNFFKRA